LRESRALRHCENDNAQRDANSQPAAHAITQSTDTRSSQGLTTTSGHPHGATRTG
jgi:hypothetical protein